MPDTNWLQNSKGGSFQAFGQAGGGELERGKEAVTEHTPHGRPSASGITHNGTYVSTPEEVNIYSLILQLQQLRS